MSAANRLISSKLSTCLEMEMPDKQFVNTQMPREMVQWIDTKRAEMTLDTGRAISRCSAPGSLDTSLSHAAGLSEIAACHA